MSKQAKPYNHKSAPCAETAEIVKGTDGARLYQFKRWNPKTDEWFKSTLDEKRFEAYCDENDYQREFVVISDGTEYVRLFKTDHRQPMLFQV